MAGSSSNAAASVPNVQALSVNVSNFVSVKLSGHLNYKIWRAQMLCLIKSQALYYIIDNKKHLPVNEQYDHLVKGWIFGSIDVKVLEGFVDLGTAQEVWMKLEVLSNIPEDKAQKKEVTSSKKISESVKITLSGRRNYQSWKDNMLSFIAGQNLLHIVDPDQPFSEKMDVRCIPEYDIRVKKWIFGYMNSDMHKHFEDLVSARAVWGLLEYSFGMPEKQKEPKKS